MRIVWWFLFAVLAALPADAASIIDDGVTTVEDLIGNRVIEPDANGDVLLGDIIISSGQLRTKGGVTFNRWPGGRIVYAFSPEVTAGQQQFFRDACTAWTVDTPLRCMPHNGERNFILVRTHTGDRCGGPWVSCSKLGMVGGAQALWIFSAHWGSRYILEHEIGHAIGLVHEHQRPDRDSYVLILEGNIQSGAGSQFTKYERGTTRNEYDFSSIMHYSNCIFSKHTSCNLQRDSLHTIQALSCSIDAVGGSVISALDRQAVSRAYASALHALYDRSRTRKCPTVEYNERQWALACSDGSCAALPGVEWKKVVERYYSACGFIPRRYERRMCAQIKREYITHWTDKDPCSCSVCSTLNEIWARCGCSYIPFRAACEDFAKPVHSSYEDARQHKVDWRQGRVTHFMEVMKEISSSGYLAPDLLGEMQRFLTMNYLMPKFESRLARVRAGVVSYARWKRTIEPEYTLDRDFFNKIVTRHRLRPI